MCTPTRPACSACGVRADCVAFMTGRVAELPAPRPKKTTPERHAVMLLLVHGGDVLLEKRAPRGIWGGLWCLPQFENEDAARDWFERHELIAHSGERLAPFTHTFTHFKLHISPLRIELTKRTTHDARDGMVWLDAHDALGAAIPTPVRTLLNRYCVK